LKKYAAPFNNENIKKHVNKIKSAVGNLTTILNDFLSLERLEAGNVRANTEHFDLVKLAEEVTEEMQMIAKEEQHIIYQHTGVERFADLDQNLLRNCMINLISNAIKYSGEHTFIEFNTEIHGANYVISISDNGIGIPALDQKNLFQPFFRANNTGNIPGTGLGLNIVLRYAKLMNGTVEFASEVDKGATFTLSFNRS
jgi:two-component system sensor kinase FixL